MGKRKLGERENDSSETERDDAGPCVRQRVRERTSDKKSRGRVREGEQIRETK